MFDAQHANTQLRRGWLAATLPLSMSGRLRLTATTYGIKVRDIGFLPFLSLLSGFSLSEDRFNSNFMQFTGH